MVCYCRLIFYFAACFVLPAQAVLLPDAVLEETVFNLGADEAENREQAYKKIFENPQAYMKFLVIASTSDDLEIKTKAQDLLFFAELGLGSCTRKEIFDDAVTLRGLEVGPAKRAMRKVITQYIKDGNLSLEEYFVLIKLERKYPVKDQFLLKSFIVAQASQAFTSVLPKGETPFMYMNRVFCPPTPLSFSFNEIIGRLNALNGGSFQSLAQHEPLASWERLTVDPLLYEGSIRGVNPSERISRILDLALHRTDQLNRIFTELGAPYSSETSIHSGGSIYGLGWFDALRFTYDWMKQNQEGKEPSRREYADQIILANMQSESKGQHIGIALAAIGCVPDRELVCKLGASEEDMELYYKEVGILSSETAAQGVEDSLKRLKGNSNQGKEIAFFYGMLSQLEDKGEYELVKKACADFLSLVDRDLIDASLDILNGSCRNIRRCPLLLQCAIVNQYPSLLGFMDLVSMENALSPQDEQGREMFYRLFADLPIAERRHLFSLTQQGGENWADFLDSKLETLFVQDKKEDSQYGDDLAHLSQWLYSAGWEKQALKVALFSQSKPQIFYPLTLYYTVRLLIEQGDAAKAEAFLNRYSSDVYVRASSYWLAKADIAKAKKEEENASIYLRYAQALNVLDIPLDGFFDRNSMALFVSNLVRGGYLKEAEKSQRFDQESPSSLLQIAQVYMKRGAWYDARFYFEYYLHRVLAKYPAILESTVYGVRAQSELAQALYYMGQGESERAKPHLDLCFELFLDQPELAKDVFSVLCGPLAVASLEQKQQWLDKGLASMQELYTKMPKHYFYQHAVQFLQELKPQPSTAKVTKHFKCPHVVSLDGELRTWTHNGKKVEGAIRSCETSYSVRVKDKSTGALIGFNFDGLAAEDVAYAKVWDRYRVLKEDYAASCAQHPNQLVWLEDAARAQQLARVLAKPLLIVALPVKNSDAYKELDPVLTSEKLYELVGDKAVCTLLQPEADGTWSPRNEAFIRGYGGGQGDLSTKVPAFFFEKGGNHLATMFPDKEKLEGDLLKFTEQNFLRKDKVIKFVD